MQTDCGQKNKGVRICPEGARYVEKVLAGQPKKAVMACEGGCIKGEVARVAANVLAYQLERDNSVRICLGDAVTGDSGFVELVKQAPETIIIEGCFLHCGTEIMKKRLPDFAPVVVEANQLYSFDREKYFEIFDIPRSEIDQYAKTVAEYVQRTKLKGIIDERPLVPKCSSCSSCE